jgi:type VI secretion system protein ImpA
MTEEKQKPKKSTPSAPDEQDGQDERFSNPRAPFRMEMDMLLTPISEENPAGSDLRYEGMYDLIREARREEDASLPQGVWERDLKKADWEKVRDLCQDALESHSKDLQIAVWLTEALFHLNGFSGIREGFRIIVVLCETFWDDLYPNSENGDFESRISPLVWMNEKLSVHLKFEPITRPQRKENAAYNYADWEQANLLENLASKDKKAFEEAEKVNKVTRAKFLSSVMFTSAAFYRWQHRDLGRSLENLRKLNAFLDERCGREAPSLAQLRSILDDIHGLIGSFLKEKIDEVGENSDADPSEMETEGQDVTFGYGKSNEMKSVALSIRSRSEAYRMLSEAADYLFIHEPHSPTPYLVKRAVSWGNMSLTELLEELLADDNDRKIIFNLLGIKF